MLGPVLPLLVSLGKVKRMITSEGDKDVSDGGGDGNAVDDGGDLGAGQTFWGLLAEGSSSVHQWVLSGAGMTTVLKALSSAGFHPSGRQRHQVRRVWDSAPTLLVGM